MYGDPSEQHDADEQSEGAIPEVDAEAVADEVEAEGEVADDQLEREEHGDVAEEADDDVHAQAEEQPQPDEPLGDLDEGDAGVSPEAEVAESLRTALGEMRGEADRIATLGTGEDQVAAAERFAEDAGKLDEQIGSAARAADDER